MVLMAPTWLIGLHSIYKIIRHSSTKTLKISFSDWSRCYLGLLWFCILHIQMWSCFLRPCFLLLVLQNSNSQVFIKFKLVQKSKIRWPLIAGRILVFVACCMYLCVEFLPTGRRYLMMTCYLLFGIAASEFYNIYSFVFNIIIDYDLL